MVTICDRCGEPAYHNVGNMLDEEDLCDKHYKEWLKEKDTVQAIQAPKDSVREQMKKEINKNYD